MRRMSSRSASKSADSTRKRSKKSRLPPLAKSPRKTGKSVGRTDSARKSPNVEAQPQRPSVVRIMGRGQYRVNARTLKRLNLVDDAMVEMVSKEKPDDIEFKRKLTELTEIVVRDGKPLTGQEMTKTDIILPSADLPIDNAKKLFTGEGVIPRF